jgi:hypothetical protein
MPSGYRAIATQKHAILELRAAMYKVQQAITQSCAVANAARHCRANKALDGSVEGAHLLRRYGAFLAPDMKR